MTSTRILLISNGGSQLHDIMNSLVEGSTYSVPMVIMNSSPLLHVDIRGIWKSELAKDSAFG